MRYFNPLYQTSLNSLPLVHRGKVRDIYAIEDEYLLIVTTDRLSAFDVVFPTPVPDKGRILTKVSNFWFKRTESIIPNQLTGIEASRFISEPDDMSVLEGRTVVVKKLRALPVEAIVRGYLIGSGWKEYQQTGQICGITLKSGMVMAEQLPEPIFTPSSKAELGEHDENISYADTEGLVGKELAAEIRDISLKIYIDAAEYAYSKGIIIADTKFEFGVDQAGRLHLIDEVLTPDSSRFWPVESYRTGISPPSYDKQFVRDYLETLNWNKQPPAPELPEHVLLQTSEKYRQVAKKLLDL